MAETLTLFPLNTSDIKVEGLKNEEDGTYYTASTVIASLNTKNSDGTYTPLTGYDALAMTYDPSASVGGTYVCQIDKSFDAPKGTYYLIITAVDGAIGGRWTRKVTVPADRQD